MDQNSKLLEALKPDDRATIEQAMAQHPGLTAAEAVEACSEAGGLSMSHREALKLISDHA
jgi:hypothetical protein